MATDLGKVGMRMRGDWSSSTAYEVLDAVTYNGSLYIAKQNVPANTVPTNTTYWQVAVQITDQVIDGSNFTTITEIFEALKDNPFFAHVTGNVGSSQSSNLKTLLTGPTVANYALVDIRIESMASTMVVMNANTVMTSNSGAATKIANKKLWIQGSNRSIAGQSAWEYIDLMT